ncbi:MAG TPA: polysaccharide deacetylase family protein [Micromonosporaceae bacterium]|jgi:peptidoglycan/xylan/chitin deacetylase (PgdA/CDA1 family)
MIERHVALTFDGGPDPVSTPYFLDALAAAQVRATFFVVGERLSRQRWLGRLLASAGHELAVHGWRHAPLVPCRAARRALARTTDLITEVTGVAPRWFRLPAGLPLPGVLRMVRETGLEPVACTARDGWAVGPRSGGRPTAIARRVAAGLRGGATILLHDRAGPEASWRAALAAVPLVVRLCRRNGLRIGPLGEHGSDPALPQTRGTGG